MFALAAVLTALVPALAGCGTVGPGPDGGIFRLGDTQPIDSLNPFVAISTTSFDVFEYIYPELVQPGLDGQIGPDFAASWRVSKDGKTWTFRTRPGARWSDGRPLTAADAAWTFNTIIKFGSGPTSSMAATLSHLTGAAAPDATTLVLTYARPVANVLPQLIGVPVLPEHIWARYATGTGKALLTFANAAPIVSGGPFTLVRYVPNEIALMRRNPAFYGPKPRIYGLGVQFFQTDDAEIAALKTGQLDGVATVAPTSVATLRSAHLVVNAVPGLQFDDFIINANRQQESSHKELLNPLLREAFDYAIDRPAIVATSLLGFAQPGSSIIPPATGHWSDPAVTATPFSLTTANRLLDQAGYLMGPGGLRIADGHPMSYTMILPDDTADGYGLRSFAIIQTDFRKIGVQLIPEILDDSAANNAIYASSYRDFELVMWDWQLPEDPDPMLSYLTCGSWYSLSDTGYCNATWDRMYEEQSLQMNPVARQRIVYQMQQMAAEQRIDLVLDYPDEIEAHSSHWADLPVVNGASFGNSKIPFELVHWAG